MGRPGCGSTGSAVEVQAQAMISHRPCGTAGMRAGRDRVRPDVCLLGEQLSIGPGTPGHGSETVRPGWLMVPGGQYHVMISTASRPARTAGSASASCRAWTSEPVR